MLLFWSPILLLCSLLAAAAAGQEIQHGFPAIPQPLQKPPTKLADNLPLPLTRKSPHAGTTEAIQQCARVVKENGFFEPYHVELKTDAIKFLFNNANWSEREMLRFEAVNPRPPEKRLVGEHFPKRANVKSDKGEWKLLTRPQLEIQISYYQVGGYWKLDWIREDQGSAEWEAADLEDRIREIGARKLSPVTRPK